MNPVRLFCLVAFLSAVPFLQAKEPDAFYCFQPQLLPQTAFVQKLTALPEWEQFCTLFCEAVDHGIQKELNDRQKLEKVLTPELVNRLTEVVVTRGLTFRNAIQKVASHLESVVFVAEANDDLEFDGALAIIINVDPSKGLGGLHHLDEFKEGINYRFLKNEADGNFILKIAFNHQGKNVEFCCAGLKLPETDNRYAVLFAKEDGIQRYYDAFKKGQTGEEFAKGYVEKIVVGDRCFRALEKFGNEHAWATRAVDVCSKIKSVEFGFRDLDGVTQAEFRLSLNQTDDARLTRDLIGGTGMLIRLAAARDGTSSETKDLARQAASFWDTVNVEINGTDILVTMKLDNADLWKLISESLQKVNNELRQKKERSASLHESRVSIERFIMSIVRD